MNQITNLSFGNFQRQYYDNNNNKIYPNQIQQNFNYNPSQDDIMTHKNKRILKIIHPLIKIITRTQQ